MCDDYDYHKNEGREDYRSGYRDNVRYGNTYDECDLAYTRGYNAERQAERERREMREAEDEYYYQQQEEDYQKQLYYNQLAEEENEAYRKAQQQPNDDLPF